MWELLCVISFSCLLGAMGDSLGQIPHSVGLLQPEKIPIKISSLSMSPLALEPGTCLAEEHRKMMSPYVSWRRAWGCGPVLTTPKLESGRGGPMTKLVTIAGECLRGALCSPTCQPAEIDPSCKEVFSLEGSGEREQGSSGGFVCLVGWFLVFLVFVFCFLRQGFSA